jgi:anti-anti-sigma regulatory factor
VVDRGAASFTTSVNPIFTRRYEVIEIQTYADGRVRLRAFGDFTWTSAQSLRHLLDSPICPGAQLTIDLGGIESIDEVGVTSLVGYVRRARSAGGSAHVVNARPRVRILLKVIGVYDHLLGSDVTTDDAA